MRPALSPALVMLVGCVRTPPTPSPQTAEDPLAAVTLPSLPLWTNKYADTEAEQGRYFRITALMDRHDLSRAEAVAVQNHFRDLERADPGGDDVAHFDEALMRVQRGELESGFDGEAVDAAPFSVVFDLDDTLLDQYYRDPTGTCRSFSYDDGGSERAVHLAPGWEDVFTAVRDAGGTLVLFSANLDHRVMAIARTWTWEGVPLLEHPDVAGVFSNSHLIVQGKSEPPRPDPVLEPSKDLRIVDPSLERVLIVDDNPDRLFQLRNTRVPKKFHAKHWCDDGLDPASRAMYAGQLPDVAAEITEAAAYATEHGVPFAQAYLPDTVLGRVLVDALVEAGPLDRDAARAHVREHPHLVDDAF